VQRVTIVSRFFPPEPFSGANRIASLANALAESYNVDVVTLRPSYPAPSMYDQDAVEAVDAGMPYPIRRTFALRRHPPSLIRRALSEQLMAVRLTVHALHGARPAAYVTSSPSMFLGPPVWIAARLRSALFVWDIRDITWQLAGEEFVRFGPLRAVVSLFERLMWMTARGCDLVVVNNPGARKLLLERGVAPEAILLVPNGVSHDRRAVLSSVSDTKNARPTVAYVGLLGYPQGLGVLVDAARSLPNVDFVLAGDGPERELLEDRVRDGGLENVTFTGLLTPDQVGDVYRRSDILFAQLRDTPTLNDATVPSKLFEYMAVGKPFVYGGKGVAVELLDEIGCAETIPPDDPDALVRVLRSLLESPARMKSLGASGRAYVEQNLSREDAMRDVATALRERLAR
jgi:glycosyltransferase involved in cell wall biosynthesis